MDKFKKFSIIFFLLLIYIFISAFSYANTVSKNLSNSVFRLHVLANSNSEEDQALKYKVRDSVLEYVNTIAKNANSKDELINIVKDNVTNIEQIAENTILENGYNYSVNISIGNFEFPTKNYGDISLPSGFYDALRIEIGESLGNNWWCVMFPPLCFVDISSGIVPEDSKEILKESLSEDEYNIISEEKPSVQFKFKLLEFFQSFGITTAKK